MRGNIFLVLFLSILVIGCSFSPDTYVFISTTNGTSNISGNVSVSSGDSFINISNNVVSLNVSATDARYFQNSLVSGAVGQNLTYVLVTAANGNWSLDKSSYYNKTQVDTLGNFSSNGYNKTYIDTLGNASKLVGTCGNGLVVQNVTGTGVQCVVDQTGAGGLTVYNSTLQVNVSMTSSNVWYNATSITVVAGTYLLNAHFTQLRNTTTAETVYTRIFDGTSTICDTQQYHASVANTGVSMGLACTYVASGIKTLSLQGATSAGNVGSMILASLTNVDTSSRVATELTALKIG